ncbi:hypothetical protein FQN54_006715 [Arachnomyces sp. PD_36]|nr:hypothetical protein FQN54_006715 [Arachnomyces sp. PD_36]
MPSSTETVDIILLQDVSTNGTTSSSSCPSPSSSPPNPPTQSSLPSDASHSLPLTIENLSEHCPRFDSHRSNKVEASKSDHTESCNILAALRAFGVNDDLASNFLDKVTASTNLEGMTPIERFLAEENNRPINEAQPPTERDEGRQSSGEIRLPFLDENYEREPLERRNASL